MTWGTDVTTPYRSHSCASRHGDRPHVQRAVAFVQDAGVDGDGRDPGYVDLGFARVDTARLARTGDPEVVYAAGKTPDEVVAIVGTLREAAPHRPALVTRSDPAVVAELLLRWPEALVEATTVVIRTLPPARGVLAVVPAGTSD